MKNLLGIVMFLFASAATSSESCKELAQGAVDVRDDYKSYAEVQSNIQIKRTLAETLLTGPQYAREMGRLQQLEIYAKYVFFHSSGATGSKLYKLIYNSCVTDENAEAARVAKQDARAAARAARGAKSSE